MKKFLTFSLLVSSLVLGHATATLATNLDSQDACLEAAQGRLQAAVEKASQTYDSATSRCSTIRIVDALNACNQDAFDAYIVGKKNAENIYKMDLDQCL